MDFAPFYQGYRKQGFAIQGNIYMMCDQGDAKIVSNFVERTSVRYD